MILDYKIFLLDTFRLVVLFIAILWILIGYSNSQTESIKTELFVLRTAIQSNSCFHLELPRSDDVQSKRVSSNIKTKAGRNRTNNRKAENILK